MVDLEVESVIHSCEVPRLKDLIRMRRIEIAWLAVRASSLDIIAQRTNIVAWHWILPVIFSLFLTGKGHAAQLEKTTLAAFDHYVSHSERRMSQEFASGIFLWPDGLSPAARSTAYERLKKGEILTRRVETVEDGHAVLCPGGLIHHWAGMIFIPGASLQKTITFLQDYDHESNFFSPDVQESKVIRRDGDNFTISLRLKRTKVVTVLLDANFAVEYKVKDDMHATSRSRSLSIREVENAGSVSERDEPDGQGQGFLWRLNSYWRFWQADGGTYVQLEAISLTRDIPEGLGWIVRPFVTTIPRDSLMFSLGRTRDALMKR